MTNSHNRADKSGGNVERNFNNHSPQQLGGSNGKRNNFATNNSSGNGARVQKSPSSNYFRSISTFNTVVISKSTSPVSSKGGNNHQHAGSPNRRCHSFNNSSTTHQRSSPGGVSFNTSHGMYTGTLSGSPPNFSHFAGSKCYDAPAPTALPKPPVHWTSPIQSSASSVESTSDSSGTTNVKPTISTSIVNKKVSAISFAKAKSSTKPAMSCATSVAKANVDFTHNLKMILNVQA
ncbi:uncharacterized protein LOC129777806 [Toxorhynchites rutilus septentrionalis]|uniref:uncharacterized protein LOC129777806 n=1 Tax=Toxorhynchites rutilus septentrionalis TaxID=329112 RepID=UPI00247A1E2D|nr:uncharacterized protein LOC129777806 [Toxorhynchites rutilus septentrionalis]